MWVRFSFSSSVFQLTLLDIYRPLPVWSASPTGILICCTVPSEAVPFVYLASLCRSLPCLISALTQAGGGGLLYRFASSVLLRGGRGAAERYRCVWGALTVFRPHWVCPPSRVCVLSPHAAQAPGCSIWSGPCAARGSSPRVCHKSTDSAAPAFCAFPARAAQAARSLTGALSPGAARLLPSAAPAPVPARAGRVPAPCVSP